MNTFKYGENTIMAFQQDEGTKGEENTQFACSMYLKPPKYRCYHNLLVAHSTSTAQIDHVVISEYGIFVLETKNMAGQVYGSASDQRWTKLLGSTKYQFRNPLKQNDSHVRTLANYLNLETTLFFSIVVFWGGCIFRTAMPENVLWERGFVNYIRSKKNTIITPDQISNIILALNKLNINTTNEQRQHHDALLGNSKVCPFCGGRLIKHTVMKPNKPVNRFVGCSNFPRCKFTRNNDS